MKRVLVTGGAGYIGSVLVKQLLNNNFQVVVVDTLWFKEDTPAIYIHDPSYSFIRGDLRDQSTLEKCFETNIDYVIHTAAVVGDPASKLFPKETQEINYEASSALIQMASKHKVSGFIFFSTCSNYGISDNLATEDSSLNPLSLYAETKVNIEKELIDNGSNLNWIVGRLSTVYGSSARMRFDLTVNDFTLKAFKNKYIDIFLPESYRPYIHTLDLSNVMVELLKNFDSCKNNVFNIGFENENYKKIEIANAILDYIPNLEIDILKEGGDKRDYQVDFSKLHKFINLEKVYDVKKAVGEILAILNQRLISDPDQEVYYNTTPKLNKLV